MSALEGGRRSALRTPRAGSGAAVLLALAAMGAAPAAAVLASSSPSAAGRSGGLSAMEAQEPDPHRILERAAARYDSVAAFCGSFTQERIVPLLNQTTRSRGTLCQKDPGYLRMDFSDREGDRVVADGEHLWMYYPSVNPGQVVRTRIGASGGRTFDFEREFLDHARERFEVRYEGRDTVTGRVTHRLLLVPKRTERGYARARIWVEADRGMIRKVEIEEENESVRRMVLSDLRLDPEIEAERFRFEPPPDVRIIDRAAPPGGG